MMMPDIPASLDRRKPAAPKPLVWSYTFLNTYAKICPHQAFRQYIKKDVPYQATVAMEKGKHVHSAMEYRLGGKPLPADCREFERFVSPFDGRNPIGEQKLGVTREGKSTGFFDDNVWGRGTLDVTLLQDKTAYIADWKTGKSAYETNFELSVHAVLLHAKHPALTKILGQYVYLGENKLSRMYDLSNTKATWLVIGETMKQVEADKAAGEFEKRQGPLCGWCRVKDCQHNRNTQV